MPTTYLRRKTIPYFTAATPTTPTTPTPEPTPFSPADVAGLRLWLAADAGLYADAGVTPITDGGGVYQWNDRSGYANHLSQSTSALRPIYRATVDGDIGCVEFGNHVLERTLASFASGATALTVFAVVEQANLGTLLSTNGTSAGLDFMFNASAVGGSGQRTFFGSAHAIYGATFSHPTWLHELWYDGAQATNAERFRFFACGRAIETATGALSFTGDVPAALPVAQGFRLGDAGGGSSRWSGRLRELLVYVGVPTDDAAESLRDYLQERHGQGTRAQVTCVGDSLTSGTGTPSASWPTQLADALGSGWAVANLGIFNTTLQSWLAWAPTLRYPPAGHVVDAEVAMLGTNDLAIGQTAAEIEADLTAYWAARRAAGQRVVACTVIACGTFSGAAEAHRGTLNTWIRLQADTWDALADLAADSRLSNSADTTYYSGDTVHLTATGYLVVAQAVKAALDVL
jgi:lysophospholipase L1-like esterase